MASLRPHLALTVSDVERSIPFYRALFGAEPSKVRPGYAKQDKIWVTAPDGESWEVFVTHEDIEIDDSAEASASACCK